MSIDAGKLDERVSFAKRIEVNDGRGGVAGPWVDQFARWAGFTHLRGGEAVMAARLEGRHQIVVRVRACRHTRLVTTDWRIADARTGTLYAIRDVTPGQSSGYIDFLCESGVAQ